MEIINFSKNNNKLIVFLLIAFFTSLNTDLNRITADTIHSLIWLDWFKILFNAILNSLITWKAFTSIPPSNEKTNMEK